MQGLKSSWKFYTVPRETKNFNAPLSTVHTVHIKTLKSFYSTNKTWTALRATTVKAFSGTWAPKTWTQHYSNQSSSCEISYFSLHCTIVKRVLAFQYIVITIDTTILWRVPPVVTLVWSVWTATTKLLFIQNVNFYAACFHIQRTLRSYSSLSWPYTRTATKTRTSNRSLTLHVSHQVKFLHTNIFFSFIPIKLIYNVRTFYLDLFPVAHFFVIFLLVHTVLL